MMGFLRLITSILLVCIFAQPIVLTLAGVAHFLKDGGFEKLFAFLAAPMTLAFFGLPVLISSLIVIPPTYYALSYFGHRDKTPFAVFAYGAAIILYLVIADPEPTGAMPGYDQTAQGFTAATYMVWAFYAYYRMNLRQP
jgi:hypothetical protein